MRAPLSRRRRPSRRAERVCSARAIRSRRQNPHKQAGSGGAASSVDNAVFALTANCTNCSPASAPRRPFPRSHALADKPAMDRSAPPLRDIPQGRRQQATSWRGRTRSPSASLARSTDQTTSALRRSHADRREARLVNGCDDVLPLATTRLFQRLVCRLSATWTECVQSARNSS